MRSVAHSIAATAGFGRSVLFTGNHSYALYPYTPSCHNNIMKTLVHIQSYTRSSPLRRIIGAEVACGAHIEDCFDDEQHVLKDEHEQHLHTRTGPVRFFGHAQGRHMTLRPLLSLTLCQSFQRASGSVISWQYSALFEESLRSGHASTSTCARRNECRDACVWAAVRQAPKPPELRSHQTRVGIANYPAFSKQAGRAPWPGTVLTKPTMIEFVTTASCKDRRREAAQ